MKVFNFKFITTAMFLLLTLFAAGCAAQSSPAEASAQPETGGEEAAYVEIAGTWMLDDARSGDTGEAAALEDVDLQELVLNADGTAVITDDDGEQENATFTAENGTLILKEGDDADSYSYSMEDGSLVLTEADDDDPLLILTFRSGRD